MNIMSTITESLTYSAGFYTNLLCPNCIEYLTRNITFFLHRQEKSRRYTFKPIVFVHIKQ